MREFVNKLNSQINPIDSYSTVLDVDVKGNLLNIKDISKQMGETVLAAASHFNSLSSADGQKVIAW